MAAALTGKVTPRGNLLAMPLVLFNMGTEMMYILEQRLKAQSIADDKSSIVVIETVRSMFSASMLSAVFEPAPAYTQRGARQVFDELAHSSIMRLNKQSMDKLYDLMTMGWKYQVLHCTCPRQLLDVTTLHLDNLRAIVASKPEAARLIDDAKMALSATFNTLPQGEFMALKQAMCRFLQDRRVKVSLFIAEGHKLQLGDGTIVLDGFDVLPLGTEQPGTVRYYNNAGKLVSTEKLPSLSSLVAATAAPAGRLPFPLGDNIYAKDRRRGNRPAAEADVDTDGTTAGAEDNAGLEEAAVPASASFGPSLLSALLRARSETAANDAFTPELFATAPGAQQGPVALTFDTVAGMTGGAGREDVAALASRLGLQEEEHGNGGGALHTTPNHREGKEDEGDGEQDLLDLLDEAGS